MKLSYLTRCLLTAAIALSAIASFQAQTAEQLQRASALFKSAVEKYNKTQYDGAVADYTEYLKIRPTVAAAWFNRGLAYKQKADAAMSRSDFERAEADFSQAIKLDPNDADYWLNRGHVRSRLVPVDFNNKLPLAIADYTQVIKLRPNSSDGYTGRGRMYQESNRQTEAMADLNKAVQLKPKDYVALYTRGKLHSYSKNYTAARSDLEAAIRLYPDFAVAKSYLDYVNSEAAKTTAARTPTVATAPIAQPVVGGSSSKITNADDGYRLAEAAEKAGNNAEVVAIVTRSLELIPMIGENLPKKDFETPNYIGLLRKRAKALSALGRHTESDRDYKAVGMTSLNNVNRHLDSSTAALRRDNFGSPAGWMLAQVEAFKGAMACRAGVEGTKEWVAAVERTRAKDMAALLVASFMLAGVRESCALALTNYGNNQAGMETDPAKRTKNLNEALKTYDEAVSLAPRDSRTYTGRAKIYRSLNRPDLAAADEQKARDLAAKK